MTSARFVRLLAVFAVAGASLAVAPVSPVAAADSGSDWVVTRTDGTVYVMHGSATDAAALRTQAGIKIVERDADLALSDGLISSADSVQGLDAPAGAEPGDSVPGRFIVSFRSQSAARVASRNTGDGLVAAFSHAIDGFVADLTPAQYDTLSNDPNVVAIEPDTVVAPGTEQTNATWGLDRIDQRTRPLSGTYNYTLDGTGVTAYVIDSGIRATHTEFTGRVAPGFTAVTDGNGTNDCMGHGTHVAGTIGGTTWGVAKKVTLVPVRVFGCSGGATQSQVIAGIDWAIANHQAGVPAVANMSLGGGYSVTSNQAVARGVADGIVFAVAAGNSNVDACGTSPASEPSAITVAAVDSSDTRASFSNYGSCTDIFAPGVGITSAYYFNDTMSAGMSGTSMATPHVTGAAALYLQANRTATPAQVQAGLLSAATSGAVANAMPGTPNRLLYTASFLNAPAGPPSAPTAPTATVGDSSVTLAWAAPSFDGGAAITDYVIQYAPLTSTNTTPTWVTFADSVSTARTAAVTGLVNYAPYAFRIAAVNSVGTSAWGATVSATPIPVGVASAPRGLTATAGRQVVSLYWAAPITNGGSPVTDYLVEYSTTLTPAWTPFVRAASTSRAVTVTGLTANVNYTFRVTAINARGASAPSNYATATPTPVTAPTAVRNLSAVVTYNGASVYWTAPLDLGGGSLTAFVADWSMEIAPGVRVWSVPQRLPATARSTSFTGLAGGTPHTFRVRAVNEFGTSTDAVVLATPVAPSVPSAPLLDRALPGYNTLSVYYGGSTKSNGSAISGYVAEYSTDNGATWQRSPVAAASARVILLSGLTGGAPHQVRVRAINAVGESLPSRTDTVVPTAIRPPSEPRFLSTSVSGTNIWLGWSVPLTSNGSPITGYEVWQSTDGTNFSRIAQLPASARSYSITNAVNGSDYTFYVTALNAIGASAGSVRATAKPRVSGTPTAPTKLTATARVNSVALSWTASTSSSSTPVIDYIVEYAVSPSNAFVVFNDGVSTATTATVTGLTAGTQVAFRVKARNKVGDSPYSATVTATPTSSVTAPSAPQNVVAIAGDTRAGVSWLAPSSNGGSAITGYTVSMAANGTTSTGCVTTSLSCVVSGLTNGVTYTVTVTATNTVGTGPAGGPATVTPVYAAIAPVAAASWGLDRIDQRNLPLDSMITRASDGSGVDAYIIDTGVLATQTQFAGRLATGYSVIADGNGTNDCNGHGTHVAGTVAGSTFGVANAARIIPVRVLDCTGSGSTSGVVDGINWMINHHVAGQPAVANLSLGGGYSATLNDAVARAVADGIVVVVAAGNSNADACLSSPSSASSAITVAASTGTDYKASYSNFGACVDLFAPGSSITSAGISSSTSTATMSGTSMASPHVAGLAAVILANARSLTPAQVADKIRTDATLGVLTGVDSSTTNSLSYMAAQSVASLSIDGSPAAAQSADEAVADETSAAGPNFADAPEADAPAAPSPAAPVVTAPAASKGTVTVNMTRTVAVTKVVRAGKNFRISVNAPKGALVKVWRNGRLVAFGTRRVFTVPANGARTARFTASS